MPNYDYECDACGHRFEEFQSMNDKHLTVCPKCRKPTLRRLIGTGAGIIFKGTGFYQTDYKKNGASDSSSKSEPKPEAAPAPSTDKSCGTCGKSGPNVCD